MKIEARVEWRSLTKEQKSKFGADLDIDAKVFNYPIRAVSVWYQGPDIESSMFASDIAEALQTARTLIVQSPGGFISMRESGRFGQRVRREDTGVVVQSTSDSLSRALSDSIIKELTVFGFDASRQKDPPFGKNPTPHVWVNVEPRPEGPQGEYKLQAEREAKTKKTSKSR